MDENDAVAFALLVIGRRDKKAHVQAIANQRDGQHPEYGSELACQWVKSGG